MTIAHIFSLLLFAGVTSITPGPNNIMLMASGANFGFRRTLPHLAGVIVGFGLMNVAVGLGLGSVMTEVPSLHGAVQVVGAVYLLALAWRVATAKGLGSGGAAERPMQFLEAIAFQAVNVKAWTMSLGAFATYAWAGEVMASVVLMTSAFVLVGIPCSVTWTAFGVGLQQILSRPIALRTFNATMALLLVASLAPTVAGAFADTGDWQAAARLIGGPCSFPRLS